MFIIEKSEEHQEEEDHSVTLPPGILICIYQAISVDGAGKFVHLAD